MKYPLRAGSFILVSEVVRASCFSVAGSNPGLEFSLP